jgi:hypothetical protein
MVVVDGGVDVLSIRAKLEEVLESREVLVDGQIVLGRIGFGQSPRLGVISRM